MTTLVLTVIGDDRAGLVSSLSEVIEAHGGNWTTSQMAELAGTFAGIVLVDVDDAREGELTAALEPLKGLLDITVQAGRDGAAAAAVRIEVDVVGDDRPGIVHQIADAASRAGASIETLSSAVTEAPMAGGMLFAAHAVIRVDDRDAASRLQFEIERLADELMVDVAFS